MKPLIVNLTARFMRFQQDIAMHIIRWAGKDLVAPPPSAFPDYVTADPRITPLVIMAAWHHEEGTEGRQAELNACMESLRECEVMLGASVRMLGELSVQYGVQEAFVRMMANHVLLGINLQRRLSQ